MKNIIFIISLLLPFHAVAEVEIWRCLYTKVNNNIVSTKGQTLIYSKIDTGIPAIFHRSQGKWVQYPYKNLTYDAEHNYLYVTYKSKILYLYDLVEKQKYNYHIYEDEPYYASMVWTCEVVVEESYYNYLKKFY